MIKKVARAYSNIATEGSVGSYNSGQLIVLVYERILDHLRVGKAALEKGDYAIESFTKANDLIQQGLLACLDERSGGEIALNLGAIYEWCLREIIRGRIDRSPQVINDVIDVLTPLYEAWIALIPEELKQQNSSFEALVD